MIGRNLTISAALALLACVGCSVDQTGGTATGSGNARVAVVGGRLVDTRGVVLTRASVQLFAKADMRAQVAPTYQTQTDTAGGFVFDSVAAGVYMLSAFSDDSGLVCLDTAPRIDDGWREFDRRGEASVLNPAYGIDHIELCGCREMGGYRNGRLLLS